MPTTPLLSWDTIHVGAVQWTESRDRIPCDIPRGVELRAEPATRSEPVLVPERPWEAGGLSSAQVMFDAGLYRMWYAAKGAGKRETHALCYAESDDGLIWRRPDLGLNDWQGSAANNIAYAGPEAASACVLRDPHAPPESRYRIMSFTAWFEGEPGVRLDVDEGHRRLDVQNAAQPGEEVLPVRIEGKMVGLNSSDGLRWTPIPEPLLDEWHDTHNICAWCPDRGKYVAYLRGFYAGRRAISYAETDDFTAWPPSELIHHQTPADAPDVSLYSNCYTRYPGVAGTHLMFPAVYHQASDTVDVELAVSIDGKRWSRHAGQPIVPLADTDASIYAEPELLRFPDEGKFRLLCHTGKAYHNEWYIETLRERARESCYQWAEWEEDRLAGIHAEGDGEFTITQRPCGDQLFANFRAEPGGWVLFELVDRLVWPPLRCKGLPGHCFQDMQPLTGDHKAHLVSWETGADLSDLRGRDVAVRVRLHKATLYSITFAGADAPANGEDPRFPV